MNDHRELKEKVRAIIKTHQAKQWNGVNVGQAMADVIPLLPDKILAAIEDFSRFVGGEVLAGAIADHLRQYLDALLDPLTGDAKCWREEYLLNRDTLSDAHKTLVPGWTWQDILESAARLDRQDMDDG